MKICIIGPGKKFLSGITYYTIRLSNALSKSRKISVITLRNQLPRFLFGGSGRVGDKISSLELNQKIKFYDGIDWYWIPSIFQAFSFLKKRDPDIILLQWWTSSAAHTYLLLKTLNKLIFRKKLIIEFHETLDPLEESKILLRFYARVMGRLIFQGINAYVAHSKYDRNLLHEKYNLDLNKIYVVPHGSYEHFVKKIKVKKDASVCNVLYFGLIRPYKGVEYLVRAFDAIPEELIHNFQLTVVGETWEKHVLPGELIEGSRYRDRITFVNRYVDDKEVNEVFSKADVLVLPYLRASQSGAAHIAISYGLPVIVSRVGGLVESMGEYDGTTFVEPRNIEQLTKEIINSCENKGRRFKNPHPWEKTIEAYDVIFRQLQGEHKC